MLVQLFAMLVLFFTSAAYGAAPVMNIQEVTTNTGITAWLVENHDLPMVSVEVAVRAGAAFDPEGKRGAASLTASLLTQGANGLDVQAFQQQLDDVGARLSASAGLLNITLGLDALPEVTPQAFALFASSLAAPNFTQADFTRVKDAALASRQRVTENPRTLAAEAFAPLIYGRYHPYSLPLMGTEQTLANINITDVRHYHKKMFTRKNMVISVVGAITPQTLKHLIEKEFAQLPQGKGPSTITQAPKVPAPALQKIVLPIPQTTILMGHRGISRDDADFFPVLFANHVLGGGGFASLLMEEVREKRGLVYGIYSAFTPLPFWGAFQITAQTKNETAAEVVRLVKEQITALQQNGISQQRYDDAMAYLVGSFPLRLSSNADILAYLTFMQTEGLSKDYMNTWVANIRKVTRADVARAFKERLTPEGMVVVMVGNPDGVPAQEIRPQATPVVPSSPVVAQTPPKLLPKKTEEQPTEHTAAITQAAPTLPPVEEETIAAPISQPQPTPLPPRVESAAKQNDYRELKDAPTKERTRRNTNAKKWL